MRNDFWNAIVVTNELTLKVNQYILSIKKFKLVVGKGMNYKQPQYYDIPQDGLVWKLLNNYKPINKYDINWWNYHSRRIFLKYQLPNCEGGVINYLRICKSKWIESQKTSLIEKNILHKRLNHTYDCTVSYYL